MVRFGSQIVAVALSFSMALVGSSFAGDESVGSKLVVVTGEGITQEAACSDALRKALEQGGAVEISAFSRTDNFELIRDTIYARADGIIQDYDIKKQGETNDGAYFCTVRAKVRKEAIARSWGEVQNVLDQIGRPGVVVYIDEYIDGALQNSSILESAIERRLLDAGFALYARQQLDALRRNESGDASAEGNLAKVRAIAKDFPSQLIITGAAHANAAGVRRLAGQETAMYNGDAVIKMFYSDTGQLAASESLATWRGGARGYYERSPQAGRKALQNAGEELVERCYRTIMKHWATRISSGGELKLEIQGMTVAQALKLKKKLRALDRDRIIRVDGPSATKGLVTFRIKAKMTAETLAEYLVEDEWANLIEIVDLKSNRIQARKVRN